MNNQTLKFKILDKLSAFPNSELIEQVKDMVKSIDDDSPVFNIPLPPVDPELEAHIDKLVNEGCKKSNPLCSCGETAHHSTLSRNGIDSMYFCDSCFEKKFISRQAADRR